MVKQIVVIEVACNGCGKTIRFETTKNRVKQFGTNSQGLYRGLFPREQFPKWDLDGQSEYCSTKCRGKDKIESIYSYGSCNDQKLFEGIVEEAQEKLRIIRERNSEKS